MKVILDTCILSEIQKPIGEIKVKNAVSHLPQEDIFISVITIGEIIKGIALLKDSKRKKQLKFWIESIMKNAYDSILKIDTETAMIWAKLTANAQKKGRIISVSDGLIAATAIQHDFHIMTRNVKDFKPTGAKILNPWND